MRILLSGVSSSGKTPVVEMLMDNFRRRGLRAHRVWGGGWLPTSYGLDPKDGAWRTIPGIRETLMQHMYERFRQGNWEQPSDFMLAEMAANPADVYLLDGIRNPHDLIRLVRPGDALILLAPRAHPLDSFEEDGVAAIRAYATFAASHLGLRVIHLHPDAEGWYTPDALPTFDDLRAPGARR